MGKEKLVDRVYKMCHVSELAINIYFLMLVNLKMATRGQLTL